MACCCLRFPRGKIAVGKLLDIGLGLERFVLLKQQQPNAREHEIDMYLAQFDLD